MNEIIFVIHILLVAAFGLGALRAGKEALTVWVVLQAILANLFVVKQISFLGFEVTCSDVFAIGSVLGLNLLQEYFGRESAKRTTWVCFYFMAFFALMSQVHLIYRPGPHDATHQAFFKILSCSPRLLLASLLTFFLVQQIDLRIFGKLRQRTRHFGFANFSSLLLSQFLDTLLFSFLGLYGLVSSLFDVIFISFLLKVFIILFITPFTSLARRYV